MQETGLRNGAYGADKFGLKDLAAVHWNLTEPALYEHASPPARRRWSQGGALCAETGHHTGRSPEGQVHRRRRAPPRIGVVGRQPADHARAISTLCSPTFLAHAKGKKLFAQDLYGGADPNYRIKTRVFTELAWHSLFIRTLLIRPERAELASFVPELTIVDLPIFKADPKRHGVRRLRDRGRDRFHPQDRADRRHFLCRRDEEVGVHHAQLLPAGAGRDADALLGQCRAETATPRCSSACPAPARPRCRPIRTAR